jgi:hypothetical protein
LAQDWHLRGHYCSLGDLPYSPIRYLDLAWFRQLGIAKTLLDTGPNGKIGLILGMIWDEIQR